MLDYSRSSIEYLSVHHVGNKSNAEELILSQSPLDINEEELNILLLRFFLPAFTSEAAYSFTFTNGDFQLNPLYTFAIDIFKHPDVLHSQSRNIAQHLYEMSNHPQIKSGDLFVAYFSNLQLDGQLLNAIGIFKSEQKHTFLKLEQRSSYFSLNYLEGISIEKLDKGCLIFNKDADKGLQVYSIDRSNKTGEAQFWKDQFLMLKPCQNNFHHTQEFLKLTKNYVTQKLSEDFEVNKTDQLDMLNRSMEYFKKRDNFNKEEFEQEVFQDPGVIKSFQQFNTDYKERHDLDIEEEFDISSQAVKKQSRVFKSILKLDKNFHIYIHGNRNLIEQGVEKDGRKYYKIYFDTES